MEDGIVAAKSFDQRFPLHKLNRKSAFKRQTLGRMQGRRAGRGNKGISRRGKP